jgi:hypothetical protein
VCGNAQIMPCGKNWLAMCININASIMDDGDQKIYFYFYFVKMHKLCHVVICNWLLWKLHIVIISCKNIYGWLYSSSMCIVLILYLDHICDYMLVAIKLMRLTEKLIMWVIYNYILIWTCKYEFFYSKNALFIIIQLSIW